MLNNSSEEGCETTEDLRNLRRWNRSKDVLVLTIPKAIAMAPDKNWHRPCNLRLVLLETRVVPSCHSARDAKFCPANSFLNIEN